MVQLGRLVLLGHPVSHSLSAAFQNAALRALGIPLTYEPLDVAPSRLRAALDELTPVRGAGNVTVPHKSEMRRCCAEVTPIADRVGAVNAFRTRADGSVEGTNTDVSGFETLVASVTTTPPERVAVLGAGGAAAAVLTAVEGWRTARAALYNRSAAKADLLVRRFPLVARTVERVEEAVRDADMVVNTTPVGQHDDLHAVALELVRSDCVLIDLVYRHGGTAWIRAARLAGHRAADGMVMLLEQGARSFEFWFEREAPREIMREALLAQAETQPAWAGSGALRTR